MELITGKAKEVFLKHCKQTESFMNTYADIYLNALIIDWLDSVGIYVQLEVCDSCIAYSIKDFRSTILYDCYTGFETRQQATQEAIKKAAEIFNNRP